MVEGEGEVDEWRGLSGETIEREHSQMVPAVPTTSPTPADDALPPKSSPDDNRQSGIPSDRLDGDGTTPSPFSEGGDVPV